jgi:2-amino-4-hydroxy-6-hydroxymethyldihydropteridine diphosphokinase
MTVPVDIPSNVVVAVAIGSNLGDSYHHLLYAEQRILELQNSSSFNFSNIYRTAPVNCESASQYYLNAAVTFETSLDPRALLSELLEIEKLAHRRRPYFNAPRTLDLDLLLYGDKTIVEDGLVIPHPRFHERCFVLAPLCDVLQNMQHPVFKLSINGLYQNLRKPHEKEQYVAVSTFEFRSNRMALADWPGNP